MANILIHIGYRKAASTFIKEYFKAHDQLYFYNNKILGFNNTFEICKFIDNNEFLNIKYFATSYNFTLYNDYSIKTKEKIHDYQYSACNLLYNIFPNAKILIITRAPESLILSEYIEAIKNGGYNNFNELIQNKTTISYLEGILDYNFTINLYSNTFGKNNVIVIPFELLQKNQSLFIKYLENKLNILNIDFKLSHINPSLTKNQAYWLLKISKLIHFVLIRFGKLGKFLYANYTYWLGKNSFKNRKFYILIKILTLLFGSKKENIKIPNDIIFNLKKHTTELKNINIFNNFIHLYCNN